MVSNMDQNHILLIVLLIMSETMGALPEKYLWVNGFLDIICKVLKETLKSPDTCHQQEIQL
jgi:hypothetical protein